MLTKELKHEYTRVLIRHHFIVQSADFGRLEFTKSRRSLDLVGNVIREVHGWTYTLGGANAAGTAYRTSGTEKTLDLAICRVCLADGAW